MNGIDAEVERLRRKLDSEEAVKVKVALFGQPGSGKSSIINAITGQDLAPVGVGTDKTVVEQPVEWNGIVLVDLPGYDTARFPKDTYFEKFKIPDFDLFLFVISGKARQSDTEFLKALQGQGKVCIYVRNQCDALWGPQRTPEELRADALADLRSQLGDESARAIFTSCKTGEGMAELIEAIERHLGEAKRERWVRGAKAYSQKFLDEKHAACGKLATLMAGVSAANGLNPIPGADVAVDLGVLMTLFVKIRDTYGLDKKMLAEAAAISALQPIAKEIVEYGTKEGLLLLLKRFAGRQAVKTMSKYIPIVGQIIAASLGFAITKLAGDAYNDKCLEVARTILDRNLRAEAAAH